MGIHRVRAGSRVEFGWSWAVLGTSWVRLGAVLDAMFYDAKCVSVRHPTQIYMPADYQEDSSCHKNIFHSDNDC